ncbi:transglutaminaseTgpA domain-containing protein [Streptomyces sp. NPDC008001]|uniref:transglutaminaseTgpA domain-containing protein n=1 Tax=Streptomyces sp. NPDC008001 TaxID=3364804 RepID=UPI0036E870D3
MTGRARLTVSAAVAALAASCAMLPLVDKSTWILQAAFLLTLQSTAGALARRVPLARPVTVAVQALTGLLLLTVAFAGRQAVAGLLPGPEAFHEFGQLLQEGTEDVGRYAIPAPATAGIRLLLVGGVLAVGLAVDAVAVTYRSAAPAGLPLLALYSVAAGLGQGGGFGWLWFLAAASGYLLLLLAEGRDRFDQWGRVFSGGRTAPPAPGPATAGGGRLARVRTGRRIGALALGIALAGPAVLPTMQSGLFQPAGRGDAQGAGRGGVTSVKPLVALQDSLNQPENRELLRLRSSAENTRDLYLRIVALDRFDGAAWQTTERPLTPLPEALPAPAGLAAGVRTTRIDTSVTATDGYAQNYLPLPYPAEEVRTEGRWRYEPEGRILAGDRGQTTRGIRYQVSSLQVEPTAAQLAGAPAPPGEILRAYTRVPPSLPPVVAQTARKVTAGAANAYQQAVMLQDWFAVGGGFQYDTQVASGTGADAVARFLAAKRGFCIHFSFSMAAMARTLGIPARVAVGFMPGTPMADGSVSVGSKDAHAWPELYFEGAGWTRFEPTPSRGTTPDYTVAEPSPDAGPGAGPAPLPERSAAVPQAPKDPDACPPAQKRLGECQSPARATEGGGTDSWGPSAGTVAGVAVAALTALGLPLLPMLWRRRVRARRLGGPGRHAESARPPAAGGGAETVALPDAVTAERTLAAWRELTDCAWDYGIPPDDSRSPRGAAARVVTAGALQGAAAESALRVAAAVEQVLYAPRPRPVPGLADDVVRVREGLRAAAGRGARLRAVLLPRSSARLLWGFSRRRSAAARRIRDGRLGAAWRRTGGVLRTAARRI